LLTEGFAAFSVRQGEVEAAVSQRGQLGTTRIKGEGVHL
jgi:hypothetical protein